MFEDREPVKYKPRLKKKLFTHKDYISACKEADKQKAYNAVLEFAKKAIELKPDSGKAHYYYGKGIVYSVGGELEAAVKEFEKARELGFENTDLYENLAIYYNGKKQYGKTIELLTRAIEISPKSKGLYKFRGSIYRMLGDLDKAEADYTRQIEVSPRKFSSGAYSNRATFYASLGRYEEALKDLRQSIAVDGKHSFGAKKKVADILVIMKRDNDAINELTEIIELDPRDDDSYRLRGSLYEKKKQFDKALSDYNKSILINPDFARQSYLSRADLFEKMGKPDKAERDRKTATAIDKKPAEKTLFTISDD